MEIDDTFNVRVDLLKTPQGNDLASCCQIKFCKIPSGDELKIGEILLQNLYLGVVQSLQQDITSNMMPGDALKGPTVSKVLFSRSAQFNEGDIVYGNLTWEKYTVVSDELVKKSQFSEKQSWLELGPRGIDGIVAINALKQAKLQKGQTVLITNASYGVGFILLNLLSQQQGYNVIAVVKNKSQQQFISSCVLSGKIITEGEIQVTFKNDYKKGVDVVFDSEGGSILDQCITNISTNARIILTSYRDNTYVGLTNLSQLVFKSSSIQGVSLDSNNDKLNLADVHSHFTFSDGIDSTISALEQVMKGNAHGFTVVKVSKVQEQDDQQKKLNGLLLPKL